MIYKKQIHELVILPSEIKDNNSWGLNLNNNTTTCGDCGSHLFYIKEELGVVAEEHDMMIMNNRGHRMYNIRPIGLVLYCAKCSSFSEVYHSFCYDKDTIVCSWDELGGAEKIEIEYCLDQWDQKGDFKPQYKCSEVIYLKEKLKEYEKKHPLKLENKRKKLKKRKKK